VQERPSASSWSIWHRALRLWSNPAGRLHEHLGHWIYSGQRLRQNWPTCISNTHQAFYLRSGTSFTKYLRIGCRQYSTSPLKTITTLPSDCTPVSFDHSNHRITLPPLPTDQPATFKEFLDTFEPWETELLADLKLLTSAYEIIDAISRSATFFGISDGSVLGRHSIFGWVISLPCGKRLATCAGHAFGFKPTSFQAEGYGMLSMICLIFRLYTLCGQTIPTAIKLFTDNKGLINRIHSSRTTITEHPNATL
jgi:hypothetical protein